MRKIGTIRIKLVIVVALILFLSLTSVNVIVSYLNTKKAVEASTGNQAIILSKSIAKSMDVESYKQYLKHPGETKEYWKIRDFLSESRKKVNANYVYIVQADNPKKLTVTIAGEPIPTGEFGMGCMVPENEVSKAYHGESFYTGVIDDHVYGQYLTAGSPIKDKSGQILGFLAVDISVKVLDDVGKQAIQRSVPIYIFNSVFVFLLLVVFVFIQKWYQKEMAAEVGDTERLYMEEFQSLLSSVRSFRHDYLNHMQVVYGLLKLKSYDKATEYLATIVKETKMGELPVKVQNTALFVLLHTKWIAAQNNKIPLSFDIDDHPFSQIKTTDLIKILSNLLDNAIDATAVMPENKRSIRIACKAMGGGYQFKVTNTGPVIKDTEQIFKQGFSTKAKDRKQVRGQGLYIVQEIVQQYLGSIQVQSTEGNTTFTVFIPADESKTEVIH